MFTYRTLTPADAESWRVLRLKGVREFPLGFLPTPEEAASADLDRCREILGAGGLRGVFDGDALVGFCGYRRHGLERIRHRAEIGPFFVTAAFHGTGAARFLLEGVIDEARRAGVEWFELGVAPDNHRAIAFYEREGFTRWATLDDAVRVDGVAQGEHLYRMRL